MATNLNAELVNVATTGAFYRVDTAVTGATILDAADHLGYTHSDGYTITPTFNTVDVTAFESGDIVKSTRNGGVVTFEFAIIQAGDAIREMYFGATRDASTGKIVWDPNKVVRGQFVLDVAEEDEAGDVAIVERYYIPRGEVTALRAITVKNGEPLAYGVTITARRVNGRCVDVYSAVTAELDAAPAGA